MCMATISGVVRLFLGRLPDGAFDLGELAEAVLKLATDA